MCSWLIHFYDYVLVFTGQNLEHFLRNNLNKTPHFNCIELKTICRNHGILLNFSFLYCVKYQGMHFIGFSTIILHLLSLSSKCQKNRRPLIVCTGEQCRREHIFTRKWAFCNQIFDTVQLLPFQWSNFIVIEWSHWFDWIELLIATIEYDIWLWIFSSLFHFISN